MANIDVKDIELVSSNGRINFVTKKEDGTTANFTHFGTIKGTGKWCKVLEPDQYDNYAVDVYPHGNTLNHFEEEATTIINKVKALVEASGKKVNGVQDIIKTDTDGVDFVQFKRKGTKGDGSQNTPPKVYNEHGLLVEDWSKLIGNGSKVGVAYLLTPYYMASSKMVGVSLKFYAVQVIDLVEYSGGGGNSSPFGNESDEETPFDSNEDIPF